MIYVELLARVYAFPFKANGGKRAIGIGTLANFPAKNSNIQFIHIKSWLGNALWISYSSLTKFFLMLLQANWIKAATIESISCDMLLDYLFIDRYVLKR